jgi:ubiquinone/menaquinone biosynthesis C-methylase UbiE
MLTWLWLLALAGGILTVVVIYWLLVLTEGAYLGPRTVTVLYDRVARRYDGIKQFDDEDEAYFLGRPVARFLASQPASPDGPPWLLDVATGTGRLPLTVLQASQGACRVVALDRAAAMLAEARRKLDEQGWGDVIYLAHDATRLPFGGGQFPVVACLEALEFLPGPEAALAELLRVAQPGGLLVLTNRIGREARLLPGRTFSRERLSATLRLLGASGVEVMPWQMDYDLVFAVKKGQASGDSAADWIEKLRCPCCASPPVRIAAAGQELVACSTCDWRLVLIDGLWKCDSSACAW